MSDASLDANGSTLYARATPTNPAFSLNRSLGELKKDGLPDLVGMSVLKERTRYLKDSGDEYLNAQFGWAPLVSDLRKFAQTVKGSNKVLRHHDRQMGHHHVRRRRSLPMSSTTTSYKGTNGILAPLALNLGADVVAEKTDLQEIWFSGAFRYFVPINDTLRGKMQYWESQANHLLGTRPTPALVWQLAPWSWAVDWFSNVGDVMKNISALGHDSLVLQYGYAMCHTKRDYRMHMTRVAPSGGAAIDVNRQHIYEIKQRRPATPYGFGVNLTSLSSSQLAIVAALGLSKGGKYW